MRIVEILLDPFLDTRLFEMAYERKTVIRHLENIHSQLAKHLVKILMYCDYPEKVNEWADEINSKWLLEINYDIESRSWFSKQFFKQILWDQPLGTINDVQRKMNRITTLMPDLKISQPDACVVHKQAEHIMDRVCSDLASREFNDIRKYLHVVH